MPLNGDAKGRGASHLTSCLGFSGSRLGSACEWKSKQWFLGGLRCASLEHFDQFDLWHCCFVMVFDTCFHDFLDRYMCQER